MDWDWGEWFRAAGVLAAFFVVVMTIWWMTDVYNNRNKPRW